MQIEAKTLSHVLRRIALDAVRYGYHRYLIREIPEERLSKKSVAAIDHNIITTYDVTCDRTLRRRRQQRGYANVIYIRRGLTIILLATDGVQHEFDRSPWKDIRQSPLSYKGYTVGLRNGVVSVELSPNRYRALERRVLQYAIRTDQGRLKTFLDDVFRPQFPGVLRQKHKLIVAVNMRRKWARLTQISQKNQVIRTRSNDNAT